MKISIITPARNAADYICDTIASVIDQTYNDIEYILVDMGFTDETLPIFLSMRHSMEINRTKHISVESKDIYKAIEKGVEMATGDIITILGAGDFYSSDDVVSSVMEEFSSGKVQIVYGDMKFVDTDNTLKVTRRTCGRFYRRWPKTSGMTRCHPALFITKDLFLSSGGFRSGFPHAAGYEMMVRLLSDRENTRKYLRKEMVSIRQDKVNSAEAEAYRKELVRAFDVNDSNPTDIAHDTPKSQSEPKTLVEAGKGSSPQASKDPSKESGKKPTKASAKKTTHHRSTEKDAAKDKERSSKETVIGQDERVKEQGNRVKEQGNRVKEQGNRVKEQAERTKEQGESRVTKTMTSSGKKRKPSTRKKRSTQEVKFNTKFPSPHPIQ